jgi:non-ribosomal peptide synthetase component F/thioesterase domain-containing protein/acyl carrier protein
VCGASVPTAVKAQPSDFNINVVRSRSGTASDVAPSDQRFSSPFDPLASGIPCSEPPLWNNWRICNVISTESSRGKGVSLNSVASRAEIESLKWLENGKLPLDWNGPAGRIFTKFHDEDLDRPIIAHFERVARGQRNRIAITDSHTSLSFSELWDGLSGLAETISAKTKPGDLIGIALPTCPILPAVLLACLAAGRPFVVLDPHYPGNWMGQVLDDARPALILGREDVLGAVETVAPRARVIHLTGLPQPARRGWRPAELGVDQPACVVFTSGSTGRPKGIVNSQRNLLQRVGQSINAAHINAEDRFLTLASLCTIVGVRDLITALLAGASVHLFDLQRTGAREILNVIRAEAITILFAFPALLRSVIAHAGEPAGDALRLVRIGGDTTLWSDIDRLRGWLAPESAVQLIYAATEAPMMQWFVDDSCRTDDPRIPIGYPLPGNRLSLIDEFGRSTQPGEVGELIVGSPYVSLGLWIGGHYAAGSIESNGARLFRTGDLLRQRPDGLLERMGRRDRQVKIRGTPVDLEGVEAVLREHPRVRDVGVLARKSSADGGVTLVAYVCARDGAAGLLDDLKGGLKEWMRSSPPPMRPERFYLARKIPRLASSKLDLRALMALDEVNVQNERAHVVGAAEAGPADGDCIAREVAHVWQEVLNTPVRGPEDDFFDVGGDSLKAITFIVAIEWALDLELPLTLINEAPTFARFCQALREHRASRYVPLVPLKPGTGLPSVFFIHGLGGNVAELFPMTRRMTYSGAVIGIQARGLTGEEPPHTSVEAMAAEYVREVKALQPHGPYYLCGYSFGGLVAFEMAQQLWESGDEVGLVGLFDTTMSRLRWPLRVWLSILGRRLARFAAGVGAVPVYTWPAAIRRGASRVRDKLRRYPTPIELPSVLKAAPTRFLRVATTALIASARYRPGFYPGELTLFSPVGREPSLPSLESIWRKHARALSIVETAGTHSTMLSAPNAESTAGCLTQRLPVC